ncbi:hypothetical protein [Nonomuraea terrae]|nr:hypothetical protein [Nonomuraea terrae]
MTQTGWTTGELDDDAISGLRSMAGSTGGSVPAANRALRELEGVWTLSP